MSRRDIIAVTTLAAHLAQCTRWIETEGGDNYTENIKEPPACASDAMALQRLGRRARNNAAKRWLDPGLRDTVPGYDVAPYLEECARIGGEVARVVSPYGWHPRDFVVGLDGITFLCLPGDNAAVFGKGFLI